MPAPTFSVHIDTAEPRNMTDRQVMLATGRDWDLYASGTAVSVDAVTWTAKLTPTPVWPTFQTSAAGVMARLGTADYTGLTAGKWLQVNGPRFSGDTYLQSLDVNETATTSGTFPINQPMFLSVFAFNPGDSVYEVIRLGWGAALDTPRLSVWSNGKTEIWRAGTYIGMGNLKKSEYYIGTAGPQGGDDSALAGDRLNLTLLPCRRREILCYSNLGGGFNFAFPGLPSDSVGTITAAGPFGWYVPNGQAQVQAHVIRFPTTGYLLGPVTTLRYAPGTADTPAMRVWWDAPGSGSVSVSAEVVQADGTTPFAPDGTLATCRLRVNLAGDGTVTPFVYAAEAVWPAGTVSTPGTVSTDITSYITEARLSVPDSPDGAQFTCSIHSPGTLESQGATWLRVLGNRPCEVRYGSVVVLAGRNDAPEWEEAISDRARRLRYTLSDRWKAMARYRMVEPRPLDGMNLGTAYQEFYTLPGYPATGTIEATTLMLGSVPSASQGEWAMLPPAGDTAGEWAHKLWEEYDRTSLVGWFPQAGGSAPLFKRLATLGTVASGTLYQTRVGTTYPAGGTVYWSYTERPIEPEANDIRVTGYDPRMGTPIQAHYYDAAAQDPTTLPGSRPTNWQGELVPYGLIDPAITSQDLANRAGTILFDRLTRARWESEWTCPMLVHGDSTVPYWRGDVVYLENKGRFRILSFDVEFVNQGSMPWTAGRYVGEYLGA